MNKSVKRSSAGSAASVKESPTPKGNPPDTGHKVTIDHNNPGRHVLRSKATERAVAAQGRLAKLTKSGISGMSDDEVSQMAKDLGLRVRGTGAKGDVTREDYSEALSRALPVPATKAGK